MCRMLKFWLHVLLFLFFSMTPVIALSSAEPHNASYNISYVKNLDDTRSLYAEITSVTDDDNHFFIEDNFSISLIENDSELSGLEYLTTFRYNHSDNSNVDRNESAEKLSAESHAIISLLHLLRFDRVHEMTEDDIFSDETCISAPKRTGTQPFTCDGFTFSVVSEDIHHDRIYFDFEILPEPTREFNITYWIEDLSGDMMKDPYTTSNLDRKQFTPSVDGYGVFRIVAELEIEGCDTTTAETHVIFVDELSESDDEINDEVDEDVLEDHLVIEHVYLEDHISFGESIRTKISMTNADEPSDSVLYVEDEDGNLISEKREFGFFRDSDATFTKEVELDPKCTRNVDATLILEAFGMNVEEDIFIECEKEIDSDETNLSADDGLLDSKGFNLTDDLLRDGIRSDHQSIVPRIQGFPVLVRNGLDRQADYAPLRLTDVIPGLVAFSLLSFAIFFIFYGE
ncbi:MAG: hypothetical protein ACLFSL_02245 [Candidatus Woesearchaeota archaeon]